MKDTHGGTLLLVKLKASTLPKVTLLHGWFYVFEIVQMILNRAKRLNYFILSFRLDKNGSRGRCFIYVWDDSLKKLLTKLFVELNFKKSKWFSVEKYHPLSQSDHLTAWKVSIFGVFLVPYFPHKDWIRRDTSVWMRESTYQKNSEYGHFSRSVYENVDKAFSMYSDHEKFSLTGYFNGETSDYHSETFLYQCEFKRLSK